MVEPLVSVVMPVYNTGSYLEEALRSLCRQTAKNFEIIAVDDGSSDISREILGRFAQGDSRIKILINEVNQGLPKSLNRGLDAAQGKYIARMDGDDRCLLERLKRQSAFMEKNKGVAFCGTWVQLFGVKNYVKKMPTDHDELRVRMLFEYPFEHPTIMFRRSILEEGHFRYNEEIQLGEDLDICAKIAEHYECANIDEVLLELRHHGARTHKTHPDLLNQGVREVMFWHLKKLGLGNLHIDVAMKAKDNQKAKDIDEINEITQFYEKVLIANREILFFRQEILEEYIAMRWKHFLEVSAREIDGVEKYFLKNKRLARLVRSGWWARRKYAKNLAN